MNLIVDCNRIVFCFVLFFWVGCIFGWGLYFWFGIGIGIDNVWFYL